MGGEVIGGAEDKIAHEGEVKNAKDASHFSAAVQPARFAAGGPVAVQRLIGQAWKERQRRTLCERALEGAAETIRERIVISMAEEVLALCEINRGGEIAREAQVFGLPDVLDAQSGRAKGRNRRGGLVGGNVVAQAHLDSVAPRRHN